jgi:hypothetical protein
MFSRLIAGRAHRAAIAMAAVAVATMIGMGGVGGDGTMWEVTWDGPSCSATP